MRIDCLSLIVKNPSLKFEDLSQMVCERHCYDRSNPFMFEGVKDLNIVPDRINFSLGFNKMSFVLETSKQGNSVSNLVTQELNTMFIQLSLLRLGYNISEAKWNMIMVDVILYLMSCYNELSETKSIPLMEDTEELEIICQNIVWYVVVIFMFLCDKKLLNCNAMIHDQLSTIRTETMRRFFVTISITKIVLEMISKYGLAERRKDKVTNAFLQVQLTKIRRHYYKNSNYSSEMFISQKAFEKAQRYLLLLISTYENIFTCIKLNHPIVLRCFRNFEDPSKVASHVTSDEWLKYQRPTIAQNIDARLAVCATRSEYIQKINELITLLDNNNEQSIEYNELKNKPIHIEMIETLTMMKREGETMTDKQYKQSASAYSDYMNRPVESANKREDEKINMVVSGVMALSKGFKVNEKTISLMPESEHKKWVEWLKYFIHHKQLPSDIDKLQIEDDKSTYVSRIMYDIYWAYCNVFKPKMSRKNGISNDWVEFTHRIINGNVPIKKHFKGKMSTQPTHFSAVIKHYPNEFKKKIGA